jgi:ABC-type dipeptide/oligopeptide/nickel transport system ATPase component
MMGGAEASHGRGRRREQSALTNEAASPARLLEVFSLKVHLRIAERIVRAVDDVDLFVKRGECVGIVGESGSGKSTLARAILRLLPNVELAEFSGKVLFDGKDLCAMPDAAVQRLRRAGSFSMVFQDPLGFLNPTQRVGAQIAEALPSGLRRADALQRIHGLLREVGLPEPELVAKRYPHELSGGMRQRALIAVALAPSPELLVADEPTTSLDATVQLQVLETLRRLHRERNMALLVITHDLGLVAELCDRVYVMQGGKLVENADVFTLFEAPKHPYTTKLIELCARGAPGAGETPARAVAAHPGPGGRRSPDSSDGAVT